MAFRIIIDGYNFIGGPGGSPGNLERQRERLIERLSAYRKKRGIPVTVVFDGWGSGWDLEHGEVRAGIEVVFSRHGEKADAVVIRMARDLGEGALVVSSDREVVDSSVSAGAVAVSSQEFEQRLGGYEDSIPMDRVQDEEDVGSARVGGKKKGNPRRLSKRERKKKMRLNKL